MRAHTCSLFFKQTMTEGNTILPRYEEAVYWLEAASKFSQKGSNVDCILEHCENAETAVQEILRTETNSWRQSALLQVVTVLMENRSIISRPTTLPIATQPSLDSISNAGLVSTVDEGLQSIQGKRIHKSLDLFQPHVSIDFSDVAGLPHAKQALKEAIQLPIQFPHLFTGAVKPWKRMLLYGPPGTGKTRLAQALCGETKCRFYCVSSCDIISSWVGESERIVRSLFEHARQSGEYAVMFIDEIDSICRARSDREDEHIRRVKTELLQQMEGVSQSSVSCDKLFILCATNCPWELDPAFIRRFQKRIYIPLPSRDSRRCLLNIHLKETNALLSERELHELEVMTEGYSGSDVANFVADTVLQPIRELEVASHWRRTDDGEFFIPCEEGHPESIKADASQFNPSQVTTRCVSFQDFIAVYKHTHPTVSKATLLKYEEYTAQIGERS